MVEINTVKGNSTMYIPTQATCQHCQNNFEYNPHQYRGKYCSNECRGKHKSLLHKQKWYDGHLKRIERTTVRRYLAEDRGYKCEVCGLGEKWQGKPITLHVDHINGDPSDDSPSNMRLICPNCHSQTEFLRGANKGRGRAAQGLKLY
jgi:Zn finger protein HypA/HybF involved in hydrogenase expression